MKRIIFLVMVLASVAFSGCSKDDDDKFEFTPECLASTVWEGENIYYLGSVRVVWVFLSTEKLQWTTYSGGGELDGSVKVYNYTIDGKVISFNKYDTNSWVVTKCTPTELELIQYASYGTEELKLKRQFNND